MRVAQQALVAERDWLRHFFDLSAVRIRPTVALRFGD